jgi:hypothetical protein
LRLTGLIPHHGNEQIGDAGCAQVAQRGELLPIEFLIHATIEQ